MNIRTYASVLAFSAATFSLHAQFTEINLNPQTTADIQTYTAGFNYPLGNTSLTIGSVPFTLATLNGNPLTTGVVQTPGNGQVNVFTFAMAANTHATELFTLINSGFGALGVNEGSVVVTGSGGETVTLNLTEGVNIRDHNNDGFVNILTDPTVVPTYFLAGVPVDPSVSVQTRLDRQELDLSSLNGDSISTITFNGIDNGFNGEAFVAGMTLENTSTVPDSGLPLFAVAGVFGAMLLAARRVRSQVA